MPNSTPKFVPIPVNSDDNRPLPEIIAYYQGFNLTILDRAEDGRRYYLVQDWLVGIAKTDNARRMWLNMKKRFETAGIPMSTLGGHYPLQAGNKRIYDMFFATAEGLYQITQRMEVNTGIRNDVLKFLAAAGVVVDEQRIDPEKAIDAAIETYRRQGKSEKWIEARLQSKFQRIRFTSAFQISQREAPGPQHYAIITNELRRGLWKRDTSTLRQQMGLSKSANLRDHQSRLAIIYETLSEELSTVELEPKRNLEFNEAKTIVRANAESVGKHAEEQGKRLGLDIATNRPLLNERNS